MRIEKIEQLSGGPNKFKIYLTPGKIERFFGRKPKELILYNTGCTYTYGGGTVWATKDGYELGPENWIATTLDRHILQERLKNY